MNAKDTILSPELYPQNYMDMSQKDVLKLQAEISFKAGIKEVVNWLDNRTSYEENIPTELEEKKKEWGIE